MRVLDRAQGRIPQPWRTIVDWLVTISVAVAFILAFEAQVAKPYRDSLAVDGADAPLRKSRQPIAKADSATA